jgi:hypothetical protein
MAAVAQALREEDFPMDKQGINYAVGDIEVEDGQGGYVLIRRLTDFMGEKDFASAEEIVRALHKAVEQARNQAA